MPTASKYPRYRPIPILIAWLWRTAYFQIHGERMAGSGLGSALDLRAFMLRSRAIGLYRSALRLCRRAPKSTRGTIALIATPEELGRTIREEMERNRSATNPDTIRYLISDGLQRLKELDTMLSIQGHQ